MSLHRCCCGGVGDEPKIMDGGPNLRIIASIANDKSARTQMMAVEIEVFLSSFHLCISVLEPERREKIVGCVFDDKHIAGSLNDAGNNNVVGDHGHRGIKKRLVRSFFYPDIAH